MRQTASSLPVVVAGAGLAGLSAALHLAEAGRRVVLLEQTGHPGGRAISRSVDGWCFNLGPHALYRAGEGQRILADLGVKLRGRTPPVRGPQIFLEERMHPLLGRWLPLADKLALPLLVTRILAARPQAHRDQSAAQWRDSLTSPGPLRGLLSFLIRVSSYTAAQQRLSAEVAIHQLQLALKANVLYLDGGWQSLLNQLEELARRQGVEVRTDCRLEALRPVGQNWRLSLTRGELDAAGVVLALPPQAIQRLLQAWPELSLQRQLERLEPVLAGCLDLGLRRLPRPGRLAAFGIDEASYFSVHSASARLAPPGAALLHAMVYLEAPQEPDALRARLEARLDLFQPGWRAQLGPSYFYPHLTVTHALALPGQGLSGRPPVAVAELPGLALAGDWVGASGWLADAALASGKAAANHLARSPAAPALQTV